MSETLVMDSQGTVRVPDGTRFLRRNDAWRVHGMHRLVLPESVREIESSAFAGIRDVEEIVLPGGLQSIGDSAFRGLRNLRRVVIPRGIFAVPPFLFESCTGLEEVVFESEITSIGRNAFCGCRSLRRIQFAGIPSEEGTLRMPHLLEIIEPNAFSYCDSLRRVELNPELWSVEAMAFSYCKSLEAIRGGAETSYDESFVEGCSQALRLFLPQELDASSRGQYGLADADGFIRTGTRLLEYKYPGGSIVAIPEGIETVGVDALDSLKYKRGVEIRWPETLRRIEFNEALLASGVVSQMPRSFSQPGHKLTQFELQLLQRVWRDSISEEDLVRLFLSSTAEAARWASEAAPDPRSFARQILEMMSRKPRRRVRQRVAAFFTEHADRIPKELKDELQTILSGGTVLPDNTRHPYREVFLDAVLESRGLDPHDPAFCGVRAGKRGTAAPLTVKSALVPYLLQGSNMKAADLLSAEQQVHFIPAAEKQAGKVDPEALAAAIGQLHDQRRDLPELAYAFARFALDDQLRALLAQTGAHAWGAAARYVTTLMTCTRLGALLSDTGTARELMLEAPRRTKLREYYHRLHPGLPVLLPEDMLDLLHGGSLFEVPGAALILAVGDDFSLEVRDRDSSKVWKLMPKKLPVSPQDLKDLERCVQSGRTWIAQVRDQIDEELFSRYLSGEPLHAGWLKAMLDQPVLRKGLGQTILQQGPATFVFRNGAAVGPDGQPVLLESLDGIRVAHALEAEAETMDMWREFFAANKWNARFQQLEEPRYMLSEIADNRFEGNWVSLSSISDLHARRFMYEMTVQLSAGLPDGSVARIGGGWHSSEFHLGKIYLKGIDRRINRLLYHFDQLTALPRVRQGDMSVVPFYSLAGTAKLNNALKEVDAKDSTELTAALLRIKESRSKQSGRRRRLSSEFAL